MMSTNFLGIVSALPKDSCDFSKHFKAGRRHHVAQQLDQVCLRRLCSDNEYLSKAFNERATTLAVVWEAGDDNRELARFGGIRVAEHRRGDVALPEPLMSSLEFR
jgi:hypothetical protein